jgi:hypothetical protein
MNTVGSELLTKMFESCKHIAFTEEGELEDAEKFLQQIRDLEKHGKPWPIPIEMVQLYIDVHLKDVDVGEDVKKLLKHPRKNNKQRLREFSNKFLHDIAPHKVDRCANDDCLNVQNLKTCKQCKIFTYCSTTCQKIDWPKHKKTCRDLHAKISSKILI